MSGKRSGSRGSSDGDIIGCVAILFLCLVAMPIVGLIFLIKGDDDSQKLIGLVLVIVGLILWGMFTHGS